MHPCWHVPRIYHLSNSKKVVLVYICKNGVGESIGRQRKIKITIRFLKQQMLIL